MNLDPYTPMPWIRVLPLDAFFAVICERCGMTDTLYHATAKRDPGLLARLHDSHRNCKERT